MSITRMRLSFIKKLVVNARAQRYVHIKTENGHRRGYQRVFCQRLDLKPSVGDMGITRFAKLLFADYVILATIEGDQKRSVLLMLCRALLRKQTTALMLRPDTCFHDGIKAKIKCSLYSQCRRLTLIKILTIVPFEFRPHYSKVATDWIYDPEFWDLTSEGIRNPPETPLSQKLASLASGRKVLIFVGSINVRKGFLALNAMISADADFTKRTYVVLAGKVADSLKMYKAKLVARGVYFEDRYLTDTEIQSLYGVANMIWCGYSLAASEQPSGVFGRAFQFNKKVIVSAGSLLEEIAKSSGMAHIAIGRSVNVNAVNSTYVEEKIKFSRQQARAYAEISLTKLAPQ